MKKNWFWPLIYKLHRYLGLFSAVILILLSITGIALNHTDDLKLDSHKISSPALLNWYNIGVPETLQSFYSGSHWLTQVDQKLYFNSAFLFKTDSSLIGAVETDEFIVAALHNTLLLITSDGELIEQSEAPLHIDKIALGQQQQIIIQSTEQSLVSEDGLLSWQTLKPKQTINWSVKTQLPAAIKQPILEDFRSSILPLERVLLDLHSGRFFGWLGVIAVDISAVFLIFLSFSGLSIWLRRKIIVFQRS